MAPRQRIVLLVIAAVVLVGGIALAASSGDDEDDRTARTQPAQTQEASGGETAPAEEEPEAPPEPRVETIRIRDGAPVGGEQELRYQRGDTIALRFVSNAPGEVHIHGFDRYVDVGGGPKMTRFKANLEGIFEVEEHGSGEILARLEIRPK